jgi:pimeloyl-ACP methyl ester carboxylesterase
MIPASGFLRWRSWGASGRRALLLHGSTSSSATWWKVGPALAEAGWRVKAPDLPAHGASPRAGRPLTPEVAARWVARELADRPLDLVVGHSFGAAVALSLLTQGAEIRSLVLDEPPGPSTVDWDAEAEEVVSGVESARRDPIAAGQRTREVQPHWSDRDCHQAVHDLASSGAAEIAAGLRLGADWPTLEAASVSIPTLVLVASERETSVGVGAGPTDGTVLRGRDRAAARQIADAFVELDGGHCLHRDQPDAWLRAVLDFTG